MRYLSLFSGIEAASVAWHALGWSPVAFAEVEPFPSAVLAERFPTVPNWGDVTKFKEWPNESVDLIVGGSPCQSFSVAGLRKGMDDPRGNLALTYLAIVDKYRPEWIVWENVPGVLSSSGGRDFSSFIGALDEIGYGYAWRVLDAQFTRTPDYPRAVPQRRRRLFVVGNLRDWRRAAAVLFDGESLSGNPPPSRKKRQGTAANVASGVGTGVRQVEYASTVETVDAKNRVDRGDSQQIERLIVEDSKWYDGQDSASSLTTRCHNQFMPDKGNFAAVIDTKPVANTLDASYYKGCGAIHGQEREMVAVTVDWQTAKVDEEVLAVDGYNQTLSETAQAIRSIASDGDHVGMVMQSMAVRRLMPVECERLQGFPDDWTRIPWRKKSAEDCPDGPRYKAIGNSMAVNVMQWIGIRLAIVNEIPTNNQT